MERRGSATLYDRPWLAVDSVEIYWLLFLVRARGGAELAGAHKTRQLPLAGGKENGLLDIPSAPADYNFGNAAFHRALPPALLCARLLIKF